MKNLLFALPVLLTLFSCAPPSPFEASTELGSRYGFVQKERKAPPFTLFTLEKGWKGKRLHVYIEGDGHAYLNTGMPSWDPTPRDPQGLWLALNDPTENPVCYLARPGQFIDRTDCDVHTWTHGRMSKSVLASFNAIITQLMQEKGASELVLVGFSGGGGICALLAAMRSDVVFLGTCAGNLSIKTWTTMQNLDPLWDSLDPLLVAASLHNLPQRHYIAAEDRVIPAACIREFCKKTEHPESCITIPSLPHTGPWHTVWNYSYDSFPSPPNKTAVHFPEDLRFEEVLHLGEPGKKRGK